jgi:DNA replicative helicase MCM subunit Mcm2 (Cdc46/Mcm family)
MHSAAPCDTQVATQSAATDPRTGLIDMDLITTGKSSSSRDKVESREFPPSLHTYASAHTDTPTHVRAQAHALTRAQLHLPRPR